jgi:2-alkyl-3-oxoalkanoate reductase
VTSETALEGLILRYGSFYGPGTAMGGDDWMVNDIRKRRIPIVGGRGGVWSFIHIDDAARFRFAAVERGESGVYNIVDDDPAPYRNGYLHSRRQLTPDFHLDCPPGLPD